MNHTMMRTSALLMLAVVTSGCAKESATESDTPPDSGPTISVTSAPDAGEAGMMLTAASIASPGAGGQLHELSMTVYKSASCGCCKDWVSYLERDGFKVTAINTENVDQIKAENGLSEPSLKSCHTALIDGYVIEGHVPTSDIRRLLSERPGVAGLSAPGMPMMSPGMGSMEPKDYDVLAFQKDGRSRVFSSY